MLSVYDEVIGPLCIRIVNHGLKYTSYDNMGYDYHKRAVIHPTMYCIRI